MSESTDGSQLPTHFTDAEGRRWNLRLTYTAYCRCRDLGFDAASDSWASLIADDPVMLGQALYECCRSQASDAGFKDWGSFADAVLANGDIAAEAIDALAGAVINFTHPSRRGLAAKQWILRKAAESRWEAAGNDPKLETLIEASIEAVDRKVAEVIDEARLKIAAG